VSPGRLTVACVDLSSYDQPLPGLVLQERLTDRGAGDVWRATRPDGTAVQVRRLRLPAEEEVREHVRHAGEALAEVEHPHLVRVLQVLPTREGVAVVQEPVAVAGSLRRLLDLRGVLEPGEVVTLGLPLADALTALHRAGLTHGRLTAADVLLEASGRPVLTGAGVAGLLGSAGQPEDDVRELAAVLLGPLVQAPGHAASAVRLALSPALGTEAAGRPDAAALARALAAACAPVPLRGVGGDDWRPPPRDTGGDRRPGRSPGGPGSGSGRRSLRPAPRQLLVAAATATALTLAAVVGWLSVGPGPAGSPVPPAARALPVGAGTQPAGDPAQPPVPGPARPGDVRTQPPGAPPTPGLGGPPSPPGARAGPPGAGPVPTGPASGAPAGPPGPAGSSPPGRPPPAGTDWRAVVTALDGARGRVFAAGDEAALATVDVPGSPAEAADRRRMRALATRGARVRGLAPRLLTVTLRAAGEQRVVLRVADELPGYAYVDLAGRELARHPGRGLARHDVTLARRPGGWRVADVRPVT
jgi:hypothetical protein